MVCMCLYRAAVHFIFTPCTVCSMKKTCTALTLVIAALALMPGSASATNNAGDFGTGNGGIAVGAGYANTYNAPANGIISQGAVGIGTSSPANALDVYGQGVFRNVLNVTYIGGANGTFYQNASTNWNYANVEMQRSVSNTPSARMIDFMLGGDTIGDTTDNDYFKIYLDNNVTITTSSTSANANLRFNGPGSINFMQAGNVGINTTSPAVRLDVTGSPAPGTTGTEDEFHVTRSNNPGTSWPEVAAFKVGSYSYNVNYPNTRLDINLKAAANSTLTGDTNVMTLQSNGNVGIGSTSPVVSLDLSQKTDAVALPSGTTGQRPTGVNGEIRYNSSTSTLEAFANGAWTPLNGAGVTINSSGRLTGTGTSLSYTPYKGNLKTTALYGNYTIPSGSGLTASLTSMYIGGTASSSAAANTLYYVYLINVSGTTYLDLETTGHATDSSTGIEIMSGGSTRTLVGMIHTDGSANVASGQNTSVNTVATWDNRQPTTTRCGFSADRTISPSTSNEINSENRCQFVTWNDAVSFASWQDAAVSVVRAGLETYFKLDGSTISAAALKPSAVSPYFVLVVYPVSVGTGEGYHYTQLYGSISTGTATYVGQTYTTAFTVQ